MAAGAFPTIKALVFAVIHANRGRVDYASLEEAVLAHFPDSAFKKTHWSWYRYQSTKGRFADEFSTPEKQNLTNSGRSRKRHSKASITPQAPSSSEVKTIPISDETLAATKSVIRAALRYERVTGGTRKVGITGEVGEVLACHQLGLRLAVDPRSQGFDAVDADGKHVQIKTRRSESAGLPRNAGRLSRFSKHPFDYALLVLLDRQYRLAEIWRADFEDLLPLVDKEKRRNPSLSAFKRAANRICTVALQEDPQ